MDWSSSIKRFRHRRGLKQEALAYMLGCDQTAVSHWERDLDNPSLAFQRQLIQLMAEDERTVDDLRLIASIQKSPSIQALLNDRLQVISGSNGFWDFYKHISGPDPDILHDFGVEDNRKLLNNIFERADDTLIVESEFTAHPKGVNKGIRMKGIAITTRLSDGSLALRMEISPTSGDADGSIDSNFIDIV